MDTPGHAGAFIRVVHLLQCIISSNNINNTILFNIDINITIR